MATVILSAVGTYFGGPIGSAVGVAIGQQIDRAIIGGGKAREGPRIKELDIQTSSYGTQIPAIFGAMRVAGTVIWSTDLIETRSKNGGGKNRPATINYSYSASFAVALSSRPVARIGRRFQKRDDLSFSQWLWRSAARSFGIVCRDQRSMPRASRTGLCGL